MKHIKRILLIMGLTVASMVGCVALSMPGPGPCFCDPGPDLVCALEDYLHSHSAMYICSGLPRWGKLP